MGSRVSSGRRSFFAQAVIPLKALLHRLSFFILLAASVAIILVGKADQESMDSFRSMVVDAVVPVLNVLSSPINAASEFKTKVGNVVFVHDENIKLTQENRRLARIQAMAERLEVENRRLRELLHFVPDSTVSYISARVVTDTTGPYSRSAIINAGHSTGINKGQVVVNEKGLVGRVAEVGESSSRILLISDINSRIPVLTSVSGERAILSGDNTELLTLIHMPLDSKVQAGEKIFTSGDGQFFPPGIPVGIVESVSNRVVSVKPFVDWSHLEFISIAEYSPAGASK